MVQEAIELYIEDMHAHGERFPPSDESFIGTTEVRAPIRKRRAAIHA